MILSFLISVFGFTFALRILTKWHQNNFISVSLVKKLRLYLFFFQFFGFIFIKSSHLNIWIYNLTVFSVILLVPYIVEFQRRNHFERTIISNLDLILLQMTSGKSFRECLMTFVGTKEHLNYIFCEICSQIVSSATVGITSTSKKATRVYKELVKIDTTAQKKIEKLKAFRYQLKIEEKFRQKSRTAQLQARAQSVVLSILYILSLFYVISAFERSLSFQTVMFSLALFTSGTVWIWKLGRSMKWKV